MFCLDRSGHELFCSLLTKALTNECIYCKEFDNDQKKGNLEKVQIIKSIIGLLMGLRGHMPPLPVQYFFHFHPFSGKIWPKVRPFAVGTPSHQRDLGCITDCAQTLKKNTLFCDEAKAV